LVTCFETSKRDAAEKPQKGSNVTSASNGRVATAGRRATGARHDGSRFIEAARRMFEREQQVAGWYVLLWSQSSNGLHIEPFARMLESNRSAYAENRRMDYVPIFIGEKDGCHAIACTLRNTLATREVTRQPEL
jgi:hypothetical protein